MAEKFSDTPLQTPGALWQKIRDRTVHAQQCGALVSLTTDCEWIEQDGVRFLVRILGKLPQKESADRPATALTPPRNPFLPYETDLFVADISDSHVCILNKFNVVDHHLLIITRAFEPQKSMLTLADFAAAWAGLAEVDGLVFYNSGSLAGASQPHKHLQLVPLPLTPESVISDLEPIPIQLPIAPLLPIAPPLQPQTIAPFPFTHAFLRLDPAWLTADRNITLDLWTAYSNLLQLLKLQPDSTHQPAPYNLLMTRQWMLVVPRSREGFATIGVNSLGFAGALLVRNHQQVALLRELGPMNFLKQVATPPRSGEFAGVRL